MGARNLNSAVAITVALVATAAVVANASPASSSAFGVGVSDYAFDDASYSYCGAGLPADQAYSAVPDAKLELVQVVVRHGDRTPVHLIPNDNTTWTCDGVEENIYLHGAGQPETNTTGAYKQLIEIPAWNHRHGYANQVWRGSCDVGQLTDKGKSQHRQLGSNLRSIYVDKLGFLSAQLNNTDEIYARTTNVWRTKNSAESLLGALWPKRDVASQTAIPLHTYPKEIETMYGNTDACGKLRTLLSTIVASDQFQAFLREQGSLMAKLSGIFGVSGSDWASSWDGYVDILQARHCHGVDLPCSDRASISGKAAPKCATAEDATQVLRNSHYEYAFKYRDHPLSHNYMRLAIGSLLGTLKDQMQDHIDGKTGNLKFALYSGHDSTVMPLLAALQASNRNMLWPPYAANILFELWKKNDGSRVVRVIYNGQVLKLQPEFEWCDLNACSLDTFYKHLDEYIPENIVAECA
ncbi:hypothetical protein GGF44_000792 [Coemansia sp. RSA 1694]|nr:hypothetical protein IWW47_002138 [Coemansia sp. RSA 2052]KAJ2583557.1 hypothetical protein GGH95_000929 [Coemansia sp. RSA 1836]KAJ2644142.1 hypothetical protein GGF44_000792 [Coemansia sp. RSA 1694]